MKKLCRKRQGTFGMHRCQSTPASDRAAHCLHDGERGAREKARQLSHVAMASQRESKIGAAARGTSRDNPPTIYIQRVPPRPLPRRNWITDANDLNPRY